MQFFKAFPLCEYFKPFVRDWIKESICGVWDFEEAKLKGRPTWLFGIIAVTLLSAIGKYGFLATQLWPWEIIKWLIVPYLSITLLTVCAKKYQEVDKLKVQIQQKQQLLDNRNKRLELANNLKDILDKYNETQLNFFRWCIDKSNFIYPECLTRIEESKIVTPYIIQCFKEGKIPFLKLGEIGCHNNEARGYILRNLLSIEQSYFFS